MAVIELTHETLEETIVNNETVFLDFWAEWCGPCKQFAPVFEEVSEKYPNIVFGKINTEQEQQVAAQFQIRSIPTLIVARQRIIVFQQAGALPGPALEDVVTRVAELDMDQVRAEIAQQQAQAQAGEQPG